MIGDDEKEERGGRTFRKSNFNQYIVYSKEYGVKWRARGLRKRVAKKSIGIEEGIRRRIESPILKFNNHRYEEDLGPFQAHNSINNKSAKPSDAKHPRPKIVEGSCRRSLRSLPHCQRHPRRHFKSSGGMYEFAKHSTLVCTIFFSVYRDLKTLQNF